jgi:glycosyltransferase involved in cell wall biosynthesis
MMRVTADISVVICAYTEHRWDDLVAAVESAQHQHVGPREIIVVIDHNPALLKRAQAHLPAIVVQNSQPRGLSGARNSGIAVAQGSVIAFLDEDAMAMPDWLARLMSGYGDPRVLGVGGAIEPLWQSDRPDWFPAEFDWVVGCSYRGLPQTSTSVRNLIGCNMSFRREVFKAVGGFRSGIGRIGTLPLGCEETELCIRVRQRWPQHRLYYEPQARVMHRVPRSRTNWRYFCSRCYAEGRSKALVSRFVGTKDGLSAERAYTFRTLPQGMIQGINDTLFRGDLMGIARAGAIGAGLLTTAAGYMIGSLAERSVTVEDVYHVGSSS